MISYRIKSTFLHEVEGAPSDNNSQTCAFPEEPRQDFLLSPYPREPKERLESRTNIAPSRLIESNRSERRYESNRVVVGHERDNSAQSNQLLDDLEGQFSRSRISATRLTLTANRKREESEVTSQVAALKSELIESDRKLSRLDTEKQNYMRENAQLRAQLENARSERLSKNSREGELQNDNERLKRKIDNLEATIESLKQTKLDMERMLN